MNYLISLILHVIIIFAFSLVFPVWGRGANIQVTFLGAILEPIETEKIRTQASINDDTTKFITSSQSQQGHQAITTLTKPTLRKSQKPTLKQTIKNRFYPDPITENPRQKDNTDDKTRSINYQHLRLQAND